MQLSIQNNFPRIKAKIDALGKQARFATAVALTRTAQDVRVGLQKEMARAFDRPTRFTLNSLFLKPATKALLEATVWVKDTERPKHYLHPEIDGGPRPQKRFEDLLRQRGILGPNERTVPGKGAKLDSFGNMGRGQIVQILSQLQAFNLSGFDANATNSKRSRAKRAAVKYFYARKGEARQGGGSWKRGEKVQHLTSGIYAKTSKGITPVLIFVNRAQYKQRFRFYQVARKMAGDRFEANFAIEYQKALRTARWGSA